MEPITSPRIVAVERLSEGVVIKFSDGSIGFYPEALLYEVFTKAEPLNETSVAW